MTSTYIGKHNMHDRYLGMTFYTYFIRQKGVFYEFILTHTEYRIAKAAISGVARAFPGGRVAHPEGQHEEENK